MLLVAITTLSSQLFFHLFSAVKAARVEQVRWRTLLSCVFAAARDGPLHLICQVMKRDN
jgi:hypothetical protein